MGKGSGVEWRHVKALFRLEHGMNMYWLLRTLLYKEKKINNLKILSILT